MSKILNVLSKTQESRQDYQDTKVAGKVYRANATQDWPKSVSMIIPVVSTTGAILISLLAIMLIVTNRETEQVKVRALEKTIKIQEIRLNDVITLFNKTGNNSDSEIRDLELRFKRDTQNMNDQINSLASAFKDTYKLMLSKK
jgi:hypothetical protein